MKKVCQIISGLFLLSFVCAVSVQAQTPQPVGQPTGWNLIFQDEFSGTALDATKWHYCYYYQCGGSFNAEKQHYTPNNVSVSNGSLKLTAKKETVTVNGTTFDYTSGMIQSGQTNDIRQPRRFSMIYGYVEGRIKVPAGSAFFPAFWLTGSTAHPPEIDIFEYFSDFTQASQGFWYLNSSGGKSSWGGKYQHPSGGSFANEWHTYGMDWTPTYIAFYVDGVQVRKYEGAIMQQPEVHKEQHLVANFAIDAFFIPQEPNAADFPATMEVDYIRVWKRPGDNTYPPPAEPVPVITEPNCDGGDGVYLYTGTNFTGTCTKFTTNAALMNQTPVGNDRAASVKLVGSYTTVLYEHGYYEGISSGTLASNVADLGSTPLGRSMASSLKVFVNGVTPTPVTTPLPSTIASPIASPVPSPSLSASTGPISSCAGGGNGVYLYSEINFAGNCSRFTGDVSSLNGTTVGSDSASSLKIIGNYKATLYRDGNYSGVSQEFTSDAASLHSTTVGGDSVSSIRVVSTQLIGDVNQDGVVNVTDLLLLLFDWSELIPAPMDQVIDGKINMLDVGKVLMQLYQPVASPSSSPVILPSASPQASTGPAVTPTPGALRPLGPSGGTYNMVFQDEFSGTALDMTKWNYCYPWDCHSAGNGELMVYNSGAVSVNNGLLKIKAEKKRVCDGSYCSDYSSGLIQSGEPTGGGPTKFRFKYGFIEARLKVPQGNGFFPAFWLVGEENEIDMMEVFGNVNNFSCGYHLWDYTSRESCGTYNWGSTIYSDFHTFGVDWQPTYITFYYDGQLVKTFTNASRIPADDEMILLNLAIGSNWIEPPDSTTPFPSEMHVDYVRVWKKL